METQFSRTERILGREFTQKLSDCRVAIFGIGGVGGYVMEALVRSGIGCIDIVDNDTVALSNLNRQIIATHSSVGKNKVDAAEKRAKDINPEIIVNKHNIFYLPNSEYTFDFQSFDYIVDAIDTISAKLDLIEKAHEHGVPIISAMGCGNRFDPTKLIVTDIYKTEIDPLAKVMRKELKKRGVKKLKVVYSTEEPLKTVYFDERSCEEVSTAQEMQSVKTKARSVPGSTAFVPSAAGLIIASQVAFDLTEELRK